MVNGKWLIGNELTINKLTIGLSYKNKIRFIKP